MGYGVRRAGCGVRESRELKERRQYRHQARRIRRRQRFLSGMMRVLVTGNLVLMVCLGVQVKQICGADEYDSVGCDTGRVLSGSESEVESIVDAPVFQAEPENALTVDYVSRCGLDEVDRPMQRSKEEVMARLKELAKESTVIKEIYEDSSLYPEKMLEALANNPEMADYVAGFLKAEKRAAGGITEAEKEQEFPLFLQWDPRWGYVEYGDDSNIGLSGCGPVCLSMALYYLTGDETLTPDRIASYSMKNGYYISGTGTAWALMEDVPAEYGIKVRQPDIDEWSMKSALDGGAVLICSMGPGDFTAGGHFVVITGYDRNGFFINDPNCVARSRQQWSYERIFGQIKNIWSLTS